MKRLAELFSKPMKLVELVAKLGVIYGIFMVLSVVKDFSSSGFDGNFELWGKDEQGRTRIGHVSAKKTMPARTPMNILAYQHSTNGLQTGSYFRHVLQFGDYHVYLGGGIGVRPEEIIGTVGIAVTF